MASSDSIHWEVVRGVSTQMVVGFMKSVFLSEEELGLPDIVQMVIDGVQDDDHHGLRGFVAERYDEYRAYIQRETGDSVGYLSSESAMRSFIDDNGLQEEYSQYVLDNRSRWNGTYSKDMVRQMLLEERLFPLFDGMNRNSLYVYRPKDMVGIHLTRVLME